MLDEWILNLLEECKVQPLLEEVVSFVYDDETVIHKFFFQSQRRDESRQ